MIDENMEKLNIQNFIRPNPTILQMASKSIFKPKYILENIISVVDS